jgi:hypothetical protein
VTSIRATSIEQAVRHVLDTGGEAYWEFDPPGAAADQLVAVYKAVRAAKVDGIHVALVGELTRLEAAGISFDGSDNLQSGLAGAHISVGPTSNIRALRLKLRGGDGAAG